MTGSPPYAAARTPFGRGTLTAGNASPLNDGASAVRSLACLDVGQALAVVPEKMRVGDAA